MIRVIDGILGGVLGGILGIDGILGGILGIEGILGVLGGVYDGNEKSLAGDGGADGLGDFSDGDSRDGIEEPGSDDNNDDIDGEPLDNDLLLNPLGEPACDKSDGLSAPTLLATDGRLFKDNTDDGITDMLRTAEDADSMIPGGYSFTCVSPTPNGD